jgi:hypothetical protein
MVIGRKVEIIEEVNNPILINLQLRLIKAF